MSSTGRHRFRRGRLSAAAVALAALAGTGVFIFQSERDEAKAAGNCGAFETITAGKYWINNNTWGSKDGSGWNCVSASPANDGSIAWGTDYEWSGSPSSVKAYPSAVLGWHWGWRSKDTGLPVKVGDSIPVKSSWSFAVKEEKESVYNVAYDLWLHDKADTDWQDQPKHEVMVWLAKDGGAGPLGTKTQRVEIDGASWDLYVGNIGWNVYSFVRVGNTTNATHDLNDFVQALAQRKMIAKTDYLSSVEAGTEVFTGKARMETTAYSVKVG
jgi:hypothetical protein